MDCDSPLLLEKMQEINDDFNHYGDCEELEIVNEAGVAKV